MNEIKGLSVEDVEHAIDELKVNCQCPGYWKDVPDLPCPACIVYDWYHNRDAKKDLIDPVPNRRYDDVYFDGVQQLNAAVDEDELV